MENWLGHDRANKKPSVLMQWGSHSKEIPCQVLLMDALDGQWVLTVLQSDHQEIENYKSPVLNCPKLVVDLKNNHGKGKWLFHMHTKHKQRSLDPYEVFKGAGDLNT